ncbi:quinone-dependent dihydroorotate dehydrogenase [Pseudaestuariivita atlantica]|uniref:Dihydroorotate dehydrogenase (quinone) n=1 Tax=Pseudaestuariivita atlantica TaxID=1317121 RepID=A0A0L1JRP2_9RHOB|nr:quinone-dependent dihydroorotate dehydrogenase [Pseudaestuariivita atlantica]KNG94063.1 diguanylate cyclase [Pseudaestuariivita atlantica]
MKLETIGLAALRRIDPERAHALALTAIRAGLAPRADAHRSSRLVARLAGLTLPNPLGLAAGFDKNATALAGLSRAGFGFLETGAATPRPQPGNPRPRLFRLRADRAAINRFGFNNDGMEDIAARLAAHHATVPVGLNLGANKDSADRAADFARVLATCGPHVDFATINVSSPNTEALRDLQGKAALTALIDGVLAARAKLDAWLPVFVKIAPDLSDGELDDIAEVALASGIDGLIATNTTLDRTGLHSPHAQEKGGLSGAPLFERSTRVLAHLYRATDGRLPLIGVGGIASGADAYAKICAGASALQLYTALSYDGLSLVPRILDDLDARLAANGQTVETARGIGVADWT